MHKLKDPKKYLFMLYEFLYDDGILVLEARVAESLGRSFFPADDKLWVMDVQGGNRYRYPTEKLMMDILERKYSIRKKSYTVLGGGCSTHVVFHCRKTKPTIILVSGRSGLGKSSLAKVMSKGEGKVWFSSDDWLINIISKNAFMMEFIR